MRYALRRARSSSERLQRNNNRFQVRLTPDRRTHAVGTHAPVGQSFSGGFTVLYFCTQRRARAQPFRPSSTIQ